MIAVTAAFAVVSLVITLVKAVFSVVIMPVTIVATTVFRAVIIMIPAVTSVPVAIPLAAVFVNTVIQIVIITVAVITVIVSAAAIMSVMSAAVMPPAQAIAVAEMPPVSPLISCITCRNATPRHNVNHIVAVVSPCLHSITDAAAGVNGLIVIIVYIGVSKSVTLHNIHNPLRQRFSTDIPKSAYPRAVTAEQGHFLFSVMTQFHLYKAVVSILIEYFTFGIPALKKRFYAAGHAFSNAVNRYSVD